MLTAIRNNRSLTFYQQPKQSQSSISSMYSGGIAASSFAETSSITRVETHFFKSSLKTNINYANKMAQKFATEYTNSTGATRIDFISSPDGDVISTRANMDNSVTKAKVVSKQEDLMVAQQGGTPPAKISNEMLKELQKELRDIDLTKLSDSEIKQLHKKYFGDTDAHHLNDKHTHPAQANDPDNLINVSEEEHYSKYHPEGTRESTTGEPLDRRGMMQKATKKSVFKNELRGLGIAVAIGAGLGMTIGFVTTLAQSGVTPDSLKLALTEGAKGGLESGLLAGVGYGIGRTIGEVASKAVAGVLENLGVTITDNISKMINMGVVGALTVVVFSAYQFIKLKRHGVATKDALIQVGKQALFSLSLLAVSIAAQGIWGGAAGIIVSVSVGIIMITYSVADSVHQRHFAEKIRVYTIEKCYPSFVV